MSKLTWDALGDRLYETGVDHGVLYVIRNGAYQTGVAWNGLTAVTESATGAEVTALYADNIKYLSLISPEELEYTIEAYTRPDEFKQCDGSIDPVDGVSFNQQPRRHFGLCYRTVLGNDVEGSDYEYKIHIIFDSVVAPTEGAYSTINDSPEAVTFSWEATTTPMEISGYKPSASLTIDSLKMRKAGFANVLSAIENMLYGTKTTAPTLAKPTDLLAIMNREMYLLDSEGEFILDSDDKPIQTVVY